MPRLVTIGGGFGGLATALFCARRGHQVVVIDRDTGPPEGPADALATWARPGVVQAPMAHYFLARSTRVLRQEAPDLLAAFAEVGIERSSARFGPGMEDDAALTARRPVYEAVMRRFVEREPGIRVRSGSVRGLVASETAPNHVAGVRLRDGEQVHGDLIVDAAGRRSTSGRWLGELGLDAPRVDSDPCDLHYYGRHYRLRDGQAYPSDAVPMVQPLPYAVLLVFIGDNRTFSVAVAVSANDPLRIRLQDPEVFERFVGAVPMTAEWIDRALPISDLSVMAGLANRQRRVVVDDRPVATGLALVGDASLHTNPILGQGVSLTFWMAQHFAEVVEQITLDHPARVARVHEAWLTRELGPQYERQLLSDRETTRQLDAGWRGAGFLAPKDPRVRYLRAVARLAAEDEEVATVAQRVAHLLESPNVYWETPAIAAKVEALQATEAGHPSGDGVLPRAQFETLVGA